MKKMVLAGMAAVAASIAFAEPESGRDAFLKRQAYAEMQRVSGQIDVLQSSHDELAERVARIEGGKGELGAIKSDIASLRAEIDSVRREMKKMQQEIVADMTKKVIEIVKANSAAAPSSAPAPRVEPRQPAYRGPCKEYVVQPGDTLSLIAQAFATTVAKIKEMNGLKTDRLSIGQKLLVPKN
jgi:hypothetical protein